MSDWIETYVYPHNLTPKDSLKDGSQGKEIEIQEDTLLTWIDLEPGAYFAHPTRYVLISPGDTRTIEGEWWPVLNGEDLFREGQYTATFPIKLQKKS